MIIRRGSDSHIMIPGIGMIIRSFVGAAVSYLLNAPFTASDQGYANGQVLDTVGEGIMAGQLTIIDTGIGALSLVSNKCAFTGTSVGWDNMGFYSQAITRALGITLLGTVDLSATNKNSRPLGFMDNAGIGQNDVYHQFGFFSDGLMNAQTFDGAGSALENVELAAYSASTDYHMALVLGGYDSNGVPWRSGETAANYLYGAAWYIKGGAFTDWTLIWRTALQNLATLYAGLSIYAAAGTIDAFHVPDKSLSAVLQPTCLSTFTAANSADLDALTPEVGGTWTEQSGDWEVSANQITPTADNTEHIATVDSAISDVMIDCVVEISTDTGGLEHGIVLRFSDTSTYWKVSINATNNDVGLWEINAGVTERANTAVAIATSTDYDVRAIADGQTISAFVDGGNKISYASASNNENETEHGLYTYFNVGADLADFDNFAVFARTSATYTAQLDGV